MNGKENRQSRSFWLIFVILRNSLKSKLATNKRHLIISTNGIFIFQISKFIKMDLDAISVGL
jgi:ABC-type microcin C transport system permease subunit YejE